MHPSQEVKEVGLRVHPSKNIVEEVVLHEHPSENSIEEVVLREHPSEYSIEEVGLRVHPSQEVKEVGLRVHPSKNIIDEVGLHEHPSKNSIEEVGLRAHPSQMTEEEEQEVEHPSLNYSFIREDREFLESHSKIRPEILAKIRQTLSYMQVWFPVTKWGLRETCELVEAAFLAADQEFGIEAAVNWGDKFNFPEEVFARDLKRFESAGFDLKKMTRQVHEDLLNDRMSLNRVEKYCGSNVGPKNPEYEKLKDLVKGIKILTPPNFAPLSKPPPLRSKYLRTSTAVNKMFYDLWKKDLAFILPTEVVREKLGDNIHFSATHWTTKRGKECGRQLFDASDSKQGEPLNTMAATALIEAHYGPIQHPTIETLVAMVNEAIDIARSEGRGKIMLWKADLAAAFTLLFVEPEYVHLLASELTDGLTLIYHTGMFGWTGTPFAFDVITRALRACLRGSLYWPMDMYVDDLMGAAGEVEVDREVTTAKVLCRGILGSQSIADEKTVISRQGDFIGFLINLDDETVSISERSYLKALFFFFDLDVSKEKIQIIDLQKAGAYASRFSTIMKFMRPFNQFFYQNVRGSGKLKYVTITAETRVAVGLWQIALCVLRLEPMRFARSLSSFKKAPRRRAKINYDASLDGVGWSFELIVEDVNYKRFGSHKFPYGIFESKNQNTCEFIAIIAAVCSLITFAEKIDKNARQMEGFALQIVGDNTTSLVWSGSGVVNSALCHRASVIFSIICMRYSLSVEETIHIAGEENVVCDALSRQFGPHSTDIPNKLRAPFSHPHETIIKLCEPGSRIETIPALIELWQQACTEVNNLTASRPDRVPLTLARFFHNN